MQPNYIAVFKLENGKDIAYDYSTENEQAFSPSNWLEYLLKCLEPAAIKDPGYRVVRAHLAKVITTGKRKWEWNHHEGAE
jgi:hypothetical protein